MRCIGGGVAGPSGDAAFDDAGSVGVIEVAVCATVGDGFHLAARVVSISVRPLIAKNRDERSTVFSIKVCRKPAGRLSLSRYPGTAAEAENPEASDRQKNFPSLHISSHNPARGSQKIPIRANFAYAVNNPFLLRQATITLYESSRFSG